LDAVLKQKRGHSFIDFTEADLSIQREGELNDLLSLCHYHDSDFILIDAANLSDEFFNLRSGLAGAAMQKFANYQVRVAVLLPENAEHSERFKELMYEMNGSNHFRFYRHREEAENWLISRRAGSTR